MPTVSIIIPTYNRAHLICESLESVFAQIYTDYEVIVVDDGSTDNTEEVLAPYLNRIRYIKQKNAGPSVARNRGMLNANGEYIAFLDSDDYWFPEKLEKQIKFLEEGDYGFCFTDYAEEKKLSDVPQSKLQKFYPIGESIFELLYVSKAIVYTSSIVFKRKILEDCGFFDPLLYGGEDYDLWYRFAHFSKGKIIEEVLVIIRKHDKNTVLSLRTLRSMYLAKQSLVRWKPFVEENVLKKMQENYFWLSRLAWAERDAGNTKESGNCFLDLAMKYHFSFATLFRGVFFRYFTPLVDLIDRLRGKKKP